MLPTTEAKVSELASRTLEAQAKGARKRTLEARETNFIADETLVEERVEGSRWDLRKRGLLLIVAIEGRLSNLNSFACSSPSTRSESSVPYITRPLLLLFLISPSPSPSALVVSFSLSWLLPPNSKTL